MQDCASRLHVASHCRAMGEQMRGKRSDQKQMDAYLLGRRLPNARMIVDSPAAGTRLKIILRAIARRRQREPDEVVPDQEFADRWASTTAHMEIECAMSRDPAGTYTRCDAQTKAMYLAQLHWICRHTEYALEHVLATLLSLCRSIEGSSPAAHVGYFLNGDGRERLEYALSVQVSTAERLCRWIRMHGLMCFSGLLIPLVAVCCVTLGLLLWRSGMSVSATLGVTVLAAIPMLRCCVLLTEAILAPIYTPRRALRLDLSSGPTFAERTLVVVPVILLCPGDCQRVLQTLEANFRASRVPNLSFCVLSDLCDAQEQHLGTDAALLDIVNAGISDLQGRYRETFHHFTRERRYNLPDRLWMGWERKRGKLVEFARLLAGDGTTSFGTPTVASLQGVKYILTLDADSRLLPGTAVNLIGVLAHPLNAPRWNDRGVTAGHAIAFPRVAMRSGTEVGALIGALSGASSSTPCGELAASFFQDVVGSDLFGGKGAMHVEAMNAVVNPRIPPNRVLNHDKLEGVLSRSIYVSDVVLLEEPPPNFIAWRRRQARWIRGDFQMLPWILWSGSASGGMRLRPVMRWMLASPNVRHLLPLCQVGIACTAWLGVLPGHPLMLSTVVFAPGCFSMAIALLQAVRNKWSRGQRASKAKVGGLSADTRSAGLQAVHCALRACLLLDLAVWGLHGLMQAVYRMFISRRQLLEWVPSGSTIPGLRRRAVWRELSAAALFAIGLAATVLVVQPENLRWALPFLITWALAPPLVHCFEQARRQ